jgi:hypothetical protein
MGRHRRGGRSWREQDRGRPGWRVACFESLYMQRVRYEGEFRRQAFARSAMFHVQRFGCVPRDGGGLHRVSTIRRLAVSPQRPRIATWASIGIVGVLVRARSSSITLTPTRTTARARALRAADTQPDTLLGPRIQLAKASDAHL